MKFNPRNTGHFKDEADKKVPSYTAPEDVRNIHITAASIESLVRILLRAVDTGKCENVEWHMATLAECTAELNKRIKTHFGIKEESEK